MDAEETPITAPNHAEETPIDTWVEPTGAISTHSIEIQVQETVIINLGKTGLRGSVLYDIELAPFRHQELSSVCRWIMDCEPRGYSGNIGASFDICGEPAVYHCAARVGSDWRYFHFCEHHFLLRPASSLSPLSSDEYLVHLIMSL